MKNDDRPRHYRKDTLLTHTGRNPEANFGVVNPPVYHASTILSKNMAEWEAKGAAPPFTGALWPAMGTPGIVARRAVGQDRGGYRAMLMSSGLAAVTAPLLLGAGDHWLDGRQRLWPGAHRRASSRNAASRRPITIR